MEEEDEEESILEDVESLGQDILDLSREDLESGVDQQEETTIPRDENYLKAEAYVIDRQQQYKTDFFNKLRVSRLKMDEAMKSVEPKGGGGKRKK